MPSDNFDDLARTLNNPIRREIFDYIEQDSESELSNIYKEVHNSVDRDYEGPIDIKSEMDDMPYLIENQDESPVTYELDPSAKQGVDAAEIAMEGSKYYEQGDLVKGFRALSEVDLDSLREILENVAENAKNK